LLNELSTFFLQNGSTPLYMAAELGYMGIVKALLKVGADVNKRQYVPMAARFGHADATRTTTCK
jgi:hypothetical protein